MKLLASTMVMAAMIGVVAAGKAVLPPASPTLPPASPTPAPATPTLAPATCMDGKCIPTSAQETAMRGSLASFIVECVAGNVLSNFFQGTQANKAGDCVGLLIRISFHDAMSYASPEALALPKSPYGKVMGGPHACLAVECTDLQKCEFNAPENNGMQEMLRALKGLYYSNNFNKIISFADFLVLAATQAIAKASLNNPVAIPKLVYGRVDCPVAFAREFGSFTFASGTPRFAGRLPDATQNATHVHDVFVRRSASLTIADTVALIGAHTLGRMASQFSGFAGSWVANPDVWDNGYFTHLLAEPWKRVAVPTTGNLQWIRPQDIPFASVDQANAYQDSFLNTDMALFWAVPPLTAISGAPSCSGAVGGCTIDVNAPQNIQANCGCPGNQGELYAFTVAAVSYANSNQQWLTSFASAFVKMTSLGYKSTTCTSLSCFPALKPAK